MFKRAKAASLLAIGLGLACLTAQGAAAKPRAAEPGLEASLVEAREALAEGRYLDVSRVIVRGTLAGWKDPRLAILEGELDLRTSQPDAALSAFQRSERLAPNAPDALQGEGLALSALGRWDDAIAVLRKAVALEPRAWRAWNALAAGLDHRGDWTEAENAYGEALKTTDHPAIVLNNRGYSRLLQHRLEQAADDLTASLKNDLTLAAARTNLRLAAAMGGDYQRAMAPPAFSEDRSMILNNVGVAAAARGDFAQSQALLLQAIRAHEVYYATAEENLKAVRSAAPGIPSRGATNGGR